MPIDYRKDGKVAVFTINRHEALNALSLDALTDLSAELRDFVEDPQVRVGIITGAGDKSFCSRMDLKSTAGLPIESLFGQATLVRGLDVWKPLIAAVNGYAFGGALRLHLPATSGSRQSAPVLVLPKSQWGSCPAGEARSACPGCSRSARLSRWCSWASAYPLRRRFD